MIILNWLNECKARNKFLFNAGIAHIALLGLCLLLFLFDTREVMGINVWIKPMKFAASISIYLLTFAWLLHYLPNKKEVKIISMGIAICMLAEMLLIFMQAARGTTSHFNIYTAFDGIVFGIMGNFIAINSLLNAWVLILFFIRKTSLSPAMLHAWRAALLLFFLGGISGGLMVSNLAHTIPAADGGAGLPLLNWSTEMGDLRVPHFFTMHSLQLIPLISYYFIIPNTKPGHSQFWVISFFLLYAFAAILLHLQALAGRPFIEI